MFGIADDKLVVGYDDGKDHAMVVLICREVNVKLRNVSFQMFISPMFWWDYFQICPETRSQKLKALIEIPPSTKNGLQKSLELLITRVNFS